MGWEDCLREMRGHVEEVRSFVESIPIHPKSDYKFDGRFSAPDIPPHVKATINEVPGKHARRGRQNFEKLLGEKAKELRLTMTQGRVVKANDSNKKAKIFTSGGAALFFDVTGLNFPYHAIHVDDPEKRHARWCYMLTPKYREYFKFGYADSEMDYSHLETAIARLNNSW